VMARKNMSFPQTDDPGIPRGSMGTKQEIAYTWDSTVKLARQSILRPSTYELLETGSNLRIIQSIEESCTWDIRLVAWQFRKCRVRSGAVGVGLFGEYPNTSTRALSASLYECHCSSHLQTRSSCLRHSCLEISFLPQLW
jgi:hypothetical protein